MSPPAAARGRLRRAWALLLVAAACACTWHLQLLPGRGKAHPEGKASEQAAIAAHRPHYQQQQRVLLTDSQVAADHLSTDGTSPAAALQATRVHTTTAGQAIRRRRRLTQQQRSKPNIVLILMDDLDLLLNSTHPYYMPHLSAKVAKQGLTATNFITPSSSCCPSRAVLLSGRYGHNTNMTGNYYPYGGFPKWQERCLGSEYLPLWLQRAGYATYMTGKFLNGFQAQEKYCPKGWDSMDALVDPYTYRYWNSGFSLNCGPVALHPGVHQTDVFIEKAKDVIRSGVSSGRPFFYYITPTSPHLDCVPLQACANPQPQAKYKDLYATGPSPLYRGPSYAMKSDDPLFADLPIVFTGMGGEANWEQADKLQRARLRTARGADDIVEAVVDELEAQGVLDNTYVIYASDNGFHIGQHGGKRGKAEMFEEDIRLPLFVRGPGIAAGTSSDLQLSMVDLPPTLMALAGASAPVELDGLVMPLPALVPPRAGPASQRPLLRHMLEPSSALPAATTGAATSAATGAAAATSAEEAATVKFTAASAAAVQAAGDSPDPGSVLVTGPLALSLAPGAVPVVALAADALGGFRALGREMVLIEMYGYKIYEIEDMNYKALRICTPYDMRQMYEGYQPTVDPAAVDGSSGSSSDRKAKAKSKKVPAPAYEVRNGPTDDTPYRYLGRPGYHCYKYAVWCGGDGTRRLFFDLTWDPFEVKNRWSTLKKRAQDRVDALLAVMAYCRGAVCSNPWSVLHPGGQVASLEQAMDPRLDARYAAYPKFKFGKCMPYLSPQVEGAEAWTLARGHLTLVTDDAFRGTCPESLAVMQGGDDLAVESEAIFTAEV